MTRPGGWRAACGLALALLPVGGCQRVQVGGQTLAVVNGAPISRDDVDLELALLPPAERVGVRDRVLQDLIDRKLFAQDAEARGEQRSVSFVRLDRRWHEVLLAQRTAELIAARAKPGTDGDALARHRAALRDGATIAVAKLLDQRPGAD